MNLRKFCFTMSSILSLFLFIIGSLTLYYIISTTHGISNDGKAGSGPLGDLGQKLFGDLIKNESYNILVLGGDKVNKNTDTIMVVNFNPVQAKMNILSIPRDTKAKIYDSYHKINAAYPMGSVKGREGGGNLAMKTIGNLLQADIKYYVFIDTSTFKQVIDLLDGVDFYVPSDMDYDDPLQNLHVHLRKGQQVLDGNKAEQYMRFRKSNRGNVTQYYDGSDLKRINAQQSFIQEVIRQKVNIKYVSKIKDILNVILSNMDTNMTISVILKMSQNIVQLKPDEVKMFTLPGTSQGKAPYYFYIDTTDTGKIISQYFSVNGTYEGTDNSYDVSDYMFDMNEDKKHTDDKNFKNNNPSNNKSSIKSSGIENSVKNGKPGKHTPKPSSSGSSHTPQNTAESSTPNPSNTDSNNKTEPTSTTSTSTSEPSTDTPQTPEPDVETDTTTETTEEGDETPQPQNTSENTNSTTETEQENSPLEW